VSVSFVAKRNVRDPIDRSIAHNMF
jgi:hypothetical protein